MAKPKTGYAVLPASAWLFALAFSPDSKTFLTVTQPEGVVELWDTVTLQRIERLQALGSNHWSLDLSQGGRWLAVADTNGLVQIWDYRARKLATNLVFSGGWLVGVGFSPSGRYLNAAAFMLDGGPLPRFWEAPTWRQVSLNGINIKDVFGFDFSPNEPTVALGYSDGTAAWWNLETGKREALLEDRDRSALYVRFSPDGRWFATAGINGLLTLWDVANRTRTLLGPNYPTELQGHDFSPDGERLITTGASPKEIGRIWDVASGRCLATLPGETGKFYARLGFSPDGNTLFAASIEGTVLFWHAPSWEEIEAKEARERGP